MCDAESERGTYVGLSVLLALESLEPVSLKHDLCSSRPKDQEVEQLRNEAHNDQEALHAFLGIVPVGLDQR